MHVRHVMMSKIITEIKIITAIVCNLNCSNVHACILNLVTPRMVNICCPTIKMYIYMTVLAVAACRRCRGNTTYVTDFAKFTFSHFIYI